MPDDTQSASTTATQDQPPVVTDKDTVIPPVPQSPPRSSSPPTSCADIVDKGGFIRVTINTALLQSKEHVAKTLEHLEEKLNELHKRNAKPE